MHGRLKIRTPEEQQEAIRKEKEKKLSVFKASFASITAKRAEGDTSIEALRDTEILMTRIPDICTLWNYRREILLKHFEKSESDAEIDGICEYDLSFTESCLRQDPKSYSTWHHRRWILQHKKHPRWPAELTLCNHALQLDERNFHVWTHRRFVVEQGNIPLNEELQYSTALIRRNFSNYSSWHYRTILLPKLHPECIPEAQIREDFGLVRDAIFTEPSDQAAWLYSGFLLAAMRKGGHEEMINKLLEVLRDLREDEEESDCEWVLQGSVRLLLDSGRQLTEADRGFIATGLEKLVKLDPLRKGYYEAMGESLKVV